MDEAPNGHATERLRRFSVFGSSIATAAIGGALRTLPATAAQTDEGSGSVAMVTAKPKRPGIAKASVAAIVVAAMFGALGGLGVFTFGYGEGHAYLGNDPVSCANCHVMQSSFDSWQKSSHHAVAVCNDCHTPHDSSLGKFLAKADNGFFHSLAFTTGDFKDPIQIKPRNAAIVKQACLDCHQELVNHMLPVHEGGDMLSCVHCHQQVGHAQSVAPRRHKGY